MKPRLLDLYCKQGGCTRGYEEAGFEVVGVDIEPQPRYCGSGFMRADALGVLDCIVNRVERGDGAVNAFLGRIDAVHASPPCQNRTTLKARWQDREHPELIAPTRALLEETGLPYVIENVEGARGVLVEPTMLCGSAFGLPLKRHRYFETNWPLMSPGCAHGGHAKQFEVYEHGHWRETAFLPVYGHGGGKERAAAPAAMGIDWMDRDGLTQAIPPAYTKHVGSYLLSHIEATKGAELIG